MYIYIEKHIYFSIVFAKQDMADPKVLNFNKVYMRTHRRSGLLISKFAL